MTRRQNRKRQRNQARRDRVHDTYDFQQPPPVSYLDIEETFLGLGRVDKATAKSCGSCHEFIEDQEVGRGTCLHPASGIFAPWYDTPACPFHRRR
jgi:hypothetical protein